MSCAPTDAELMLRFQRDRDCGAFTELFQRHKGGLLRFLLRLSGNRAVAEDVSQHTWIKILEVAHQHAYVPQLDAAFKTWLCVLARNHYIDEYQRKVSATRSVHIPRLLQLAADTTTPDPVELMHGHESAARLYEALSTLPFEQRDVISLWAAGVEINAIAAIVGAPRDTILSRRKYALAKLRVALLAPQPQERRA